MRVDYDKAANDYRNYRAPDPRIAAQIGRHLTGAASILNIGAGTGSYEPEHASLVALEPSFQMIARRGPDKAPAVQGAAEHLPFADNRFDLAMGLLTLHHWPDQARGLAEMQRVARDRVLLFTWIDDSPRYWLEDYFPQMREIDRSIFPTLAEYESMLDPIDVETVEIPADCEDGMMCAYWRRPEAYLDPGARGAISTFARLDDYSAGLQQLRDDLDSGAWTDRNGHLLQQSSADLGYRLILARASA